MGKILGIDLGTTNSAVAIWDGDAPRLIESRNGTHLTPSVVSFDDDGEVTVGEEARHRAVANPHRTIYSAKRFIGRPFEAVTADRDDVPYEVVAGDKGQAQFLVDDDRWSPEEISAMVLRELKRSAEAALGDTVDGVVITAPAHFNDAQRAATREAGRLAGLDVRRILNEPTAAALAYGLDRMVEGERIVAVYDFGGGTFDVSVLSVGEDIIEVLATRGDPRLGGDMIDSRIAAWLLEQFAAMTGVRADEDAETLQRVREAAEKIKIGLSDKDTVEVRLAFPEADGAPQLETSISRETFDGMVGDLIDRTLACCSQVLVDAGKQPNLIDEVVLAGGSTLIPIVRRRVAEYFGREPLCAIDPEEVVAMGAAVQAGILAGELKGVVLVDVTSLSLGIETHEGRASVVIPRNTTLPVSATRTFTTSVDGQTAVQFHVVQGESKHADRNVSLGRFVLDGLVATKAGILQIEVTFTIDINGMVLVSARDLQTAREHTVTISVNTAAAREGSATKDTKPAAAPAPAKDDPGVPPAVRATLDETEQLLGTAGEKLTRVDRASVMKQVVHLRNLLNRKAPSDEIELSREALAKVVARVKSAKPPKKRA